MKNAIRYGLIYSAINIVWSLIAYVFGISRTEHTWILSLIAVAMPIVCIVLAVYTERKSNPGGFISFSKAFKAGLIVALLGTLINSGYAVLYAQVIDPDFMEYVEEQQVEQLEESGLSDEQIEANLSVFRMMKSPFGIFTFSLISGVFSGAIYALIVAAILRRNDPNELFS
jgi:MFS family permease